MQAIQEFKREHPVDAQRLTRLAIKGSETMMEGRHSLRDLSNPLSYDDPP